MVRSTLTSLINQQQNVRLGNIRIVKRYMIVIFEKNPHCLSFGSYGMFLYLNFFPQCAGNQTIRYQKINPEDGYINDTYLIRSKGSDYL